MVNAPTEVPSPADTEKCETCLWYVPGSLYEGLCNHNIFGPMKVDLKFSCPYHQQKEPSHATNTSNHSNPLA